MALQAAMWLCSSFEGTDFMSSVMICRGRSGGQSSRRVIVGRLCCLSNDMSVEWKCSSGGGGGLANI